MRCDEATFRILLQKNNPAFKICTDNDPFTIFIQTAKQVLFNFYRWRIIMWQTVWRIWKSKGNISNRFKIMWIEVVHLHCLTFSIYINLWLIHHIISSPVKFVVLWGGKVINFVSPHVGIQVPVIDDSWRCVRRLILHLPEYRWLCCRCWLHLIIKIWNLKRKTLHS